MDLTLAPEEGSIAENEPLARHTTWRIGGPARFFCRVRTEDGLARLLAAATQESRPLALLGMGSNILVADDGFPGYVLRLEGDFLKVSIEGERLTAGGGAALGGVCAAAARAGLSGIEAISGIPSSIGGAVRINAGAYGGEIFDVLETVRLVSRAGERRSAAAGEIAHGYRWSKLIETREIVSQAVLRLRPAPREEIASKTRNGRRQAPGSAALRAQRRERLQEPGGRLRREADRSLRPEGRGRRGRPDLRASRECDREHRRRARVGRPRSDEEDERRGPGEVRSYPDARSGTAGTEMGMRKRSSVSVERFDCEPGVRLAALHAQPSTLNSQLLS